MWLCPDALAPDPPTQFSSNLRYSRAVNCIRLGIGLCLAVPPPAVFICFSCNTLGLPCTQRTCYKNIIMHARKNRESILTESLIVSLFQALQRTRVYCCSRPSIGSASSRPLASAPLHSPKQIEQIRFVLFIAGRCDTGLHSQTA